MSENQPKNRRQTILIDKKFQSRYAAMASLGAILAINVVLVTGYILYLPQLAPVVTMIHTLFLGVAELLVVLVIYFLGVRSSFRIAGPMYAMKRALSQVGQGDLTVRLKFREDDCCQEIAEQFNESIEKLANDLRELEHGLKQIVEGDHDFERYKELTDNLWHKFRKIKS